MSYRYDSPPAVGTVFLNYGWVVGTGPHDQEDQSTERYVVLTSQCLNHEHGEDPVELRTYTERYTVLIVQRLEGATEDDEVTAEWKIHYEQGFSTFVDAVKGMQEPITYGRNGNYGSVRKHIAGFLDCLERDG